jgi:PAS domain S-box-containing protein
MRMSMPLSAPGTLPGSCDPTIIAETILALMPEAGVLAIDAELVVTLMEGTIFARHGYGSAAAHGRHIRDVIPVRAWTDMEPRWESALAGHALTIEAQAAVGNGISWQRFAPLRTDQGMLAGAILVAQDVTGRERDGLRRRLRQQSAVSALGSLGLRATGLAELLQAAADVLRSGMGADLAGVYEHTRSGGAVLRAGAGERAPPPSSTGTDASGHSFAFLRGSGQPLLSADIRTEDRFDSPALQAAGMVSLVAAPIGAGPAAFGFLGACCRTAGAFSEDDLAFVQSIANVLGATIEREQVATRAVEAESQIANLWDLSIDLLAVFAPDGTFLAVNQAWERTLGWEPDELVGKNAIGFLHPDDEALTITVADLPDHRGGDVPELVNRYRAKDGGWRWLMWSGRRAPDGHTYAVAKDITEHHLEHELAERREAQLNAAQRIGGMGSWEADLASGTLQISESLRSMLALESLTVTFGQMFTVIHPDDRAHIRGKFDEPTVDPASTEFRALLPDGRVRIVASYAEPIIEDGRTVRVRGMLQDVTEPHQRELALQRSEERFRQGFDSAPIGMALVDPASRRFLRVNATLCRFLGRSSDELADLTMADITHPDELEADDAWLRSIIGGEAAEPTREKRYVHPDGSVVWGALSVSTALDADGSIDVLFAQVVDITERKLRENAVERTLADVAWLSEIRKAFETDRFALHAQPIIEIASGETVKHELLIRMCDHKGRLIPPGSFLPAAEKYGAIREIDRWVISRGAEIAAAGTAVTINVSGVSLGDPTLVAHIVSELTRTGADPATIIFEITETALVEAGAGAVQAAQQIRETGCRFALDDFGTGYGGFHQLKTLPLDFLKIDQEFVRDMLTNESDRNVVWSVVNIAQRFGLKTIAEGVENQETLELLAAMDVDYAQGFLLGKPAPLGGAP